MEKNKEIGVVCPGLPWGVVVPLPKVTVEALCKERFNKPLPQDCTRYFFAGQEINLVGSDGARGVISQNGLLYQRYNRKEMSFRNPWGPGSTGFQQFMLLPAREERGQVIPLDDRESELRRYLILHGIDRRFGSNPQNFGARFFAASAKVWRELAEMGAGSQDPLAQAFYFRGLEFNREARVIADCLDYVEACKPGSPTDVVGKPTGQMTWVL